MKLAALLLALALAACGDRPMGPAGEAYDHADVALANARSALAAIEQDRARLDDLETAVDDLTADLATAKSDLSAANDTIDALETKQAEIIRTYNDHLRYE
ncbi:hypothetical protein [Sphingomonas japonica]|uniref:Septal ring factor EnvC (AmiA/AmiB activator) n=1 Tax=Sphingomonas japonica TaxID=511662 RepID=A0ABX0U5Y8_9SPHN|nr:hypothetical protein [Sphingomonas japonica]NIJ24806.1 septal ring factor EnvC (AmiA/AmiB activator) [Sphingomonas japonica]